MYVQRFNSIEAKQYEEFPTKLCVFYTKTDTWTHSWNIPAKLANNFGGEDA